MTSGSIISSAYGGAGWSPRTASMRDEIGDLWEDCGACSEYEPLQAVLLHRPGREIALVNDPNGMQMQAMPDADAMGAQFDGLVGAYRDAGIRVTLVEPDELPPPNLMFVADLIFATPEGIILGRPASTVRAGEERFVARRLGEMGIPIVKTVHGTGTFEGADAMWIDETTVLIGTGLRTNDHGAEQVASTLQEMGVTVIPADLPFGAMHLMGTLRIVDVDLAVAWPGRVPYRAVAALRERGFEVLFMPDLGEVARGFSLNFVVYAPRRIILPAGNPSSERFLGDAGIDCHSTPVEELQKACGSIACMTGVLKRSS